MKIRIQDLEVRNLEFEHQFQPGEIDFGSEVRQVGSLQTEGRAELIREHHGGHHSIDDIRLVGKLDGRIEVSCARCLEPVELPISRSFDLLYRPLERERGSDEVAINEAETEIGYYSGEGMELEDSLVSRFCSPCPSRPSAVTIARACAPSVEPTATNSFAVVTRASRIHAGPRLAT